MGESRDYYNYVGFGITHLYTSLMLRAVTTASCVAEALDLPLHPWEDIHETGGLYLEDAATGGKGRAARHGSYHPCSNVFRTWYCRKRMRSRGGGIARLKSTSQALDRARRVYASLLERHGGTNDRVAIVSHGGFYHLFAASDL